MSNALDLPQPIMLVVIVGLICIVVWLLIISGLLGNTPAIPSHIPVHTIKCPGVPNGAWSFDVIINIGFREGYKCSEMTEFEYWMGVIRGLPQYSGSADEVADKVYCDLRKVVEQFNECVSRGTQVISVFDDISVDPVGIVPQRAESAATT